MNIDRFARRVMALCLAAMATTVMGQGLADDPCQQGRRLFLENNYLAAEPLLRQCLEQGESLLALLPLTMMTVIQQRIPEGLDFGARALRMAPENVNVRYWYGRALLQSGEQDRAREQWEQGLAIDAGHAGILEGLARLSHQRGEFAKAYNLLNQMLLQGVDTPWLHRMLAELAQGLGHWEKATVHWRAVIAGRDHEQRDLLVLGELLILTGRPAEAVELLRDALRSSQTAALYGALGEALFAQGSVDSAAVVLQMAVDLDREQPRHLFNLANALQLLERHQEAGQYFRAYLEHRPDDPVGRFHYGVHLVHEGLLEDAVEQVERAVRLDAEYVQARVVLAQLYEDLEQTEKALALIDELVVLDPGSGTELEAWREQLLANLGGAADFIAQGKVRLLHLVVADLETADLVAGDLSDGGDFAELAIRFSIGPTAVRGGDIGWIDPADMTPALRRAIERLEPGTTSPPVQEGGKFHFFKRIR